MEELSLTEFNQLSESEKLNRLYKEHQEMQVALNQLHIRLTTCTLPPKDSETHKEHIEIQLQSPEASSGAFAEVDGGRVRLYYELHGSGPIHVLLIHGFLVLSIIK